MVHGERLGLGNVRSGKDKIHDQSETHHDLQSQENLEPEKESLLWALVK